MNADRKTRNTEHGQKGFTLLETTVALVVMMVGGLGIAAVFTYAIRNNTGAKERAAAMAVAQQEMERLRHLSFDDASLAVTPNPATVRVSRDYRTYAMRTNIINTTATFKTIEIQVTPETSGNRFLSSVTVRTQRAAYTLGAFSGGP